MAMMSPSLRTDSFMLKPSHLSKGDIIAMDRAYIDYEKFEELTQKGVIYIRYKDEKVAKLFNNKRCNVPND